MFIVGVTGGIGSGKSSVAKILQLEGITVLDADSISHEVTSRGGAAVSELQERFGVNVFAADGTLDRAELAQRVFGNKTQLDQLNLIIHHHVIAEILRRINELDQAKTKFIALDVPLPVKHGFLDIVNQVWVVETEAPIRVERLQQRGLSLSDIQRRMAVQMTDEEYRKIATHLISNNGTLAQLQKTVAELLVSELVSRGFRLKEQAVQI